MPQKKRLIFDISNLFLSGYESYSSSAQKQGIYLNKICFFGKSKPGILISNRERTGYPNYSSGITNLQNPRNGSLQGFPRLGCQTERERFIRKRYPKIKKDIGQNCFGPDSRINEKATF